MVGPIAPRRRTAMAARNPANPRLRDIFALLARFLSFADYLKLRLVDHASRLYCRRVGRTPPPFPWLMLPQRESPGAPSTATVRRIFYDIPGGRSYRYEIPDKRFYRCVATGHGWLVMVSVHPPRRILMLNPITDQGKVVPWPFDNINGCFHAHLTSSPGDRGCFLVMVTDKLIAYCRPAIYQGWYALRAPGFRYHEASSDVVSLSSSLVFLVDQRRKLWRVELAEQPPQVECRDTAFALPSEELRRYYLVESLGHIHLVLSEDRHKRIALYKLDWAAASMWAPMDGWCGDRVLLLGRGCSAAVPASSAAGRAPGTVLFARQPMSIRDMDRSVRGDSRGQAWFWSETRVDAGPDDLLVLKKTVPHQQGEFTNADDSFWFFPAIDPDENAR
ncbi:hypothetical protein GUJ93_ZPchr0010g11123 [Zizania palustris]|uniref:KIB1-4 beta-propeller domain-containing protein n=1 Tax=Zizania palustris TaxID=103762 RepID=A0A8J5TIC1_ZIZPA|nr:hypothetical protein GUJ93_ZPchr0010g11123 [Zizania palustris]